MSADIEMAARPGQTFCCDWDIFSPGTILCPGNETIIDISGRDHITVAEISDLPNLNRSTVQDPGSGGWEGKGSFDGQLKTSCLVKSLANRKLVLNRKQ